MHLLAILHTSECTRSLNSQVTNVFALPPPAMDRITFLPDGQQLLATIDTETDCGGNCETATASVVCSSIFRFNGSDDSLCQFANSSAINIFPGLIALDTVQIIFGLLGSRALTFSVFFLKFVPQAKMHGSIPGTM